MTEIDVQSGAWLPVNQKEKRGSAEEGSVIGQEDKTNLKKRDKRG